MIRHGQVFAWLVAVTLLIGVGPIPATAQGNADGYTSYQLNLRTGPGATYDVITILEANVGMIFEGRTEDLSWLLGHTEDGAFRGWVASLYLRYQEGFIAARLPISEEIVSYQVPAEPEAPVDLASAPIEGDLPPTGLAPTLESLPIVPTITNNARVIYQRGQALGNNANVVTKVGECNSMSYAFLNPFSTGQYDLGPYGNLQTVISSMQFVNPSLATGAGFTSMSVVESGYGDPALCGSLSPLECEYQHERPSVAFIMLGMHDVHFLSAQQYEQAMRRVIETSINNGVIPVLTTFPVWPGGDTRTAARFTFNSILVRLAQQYDVPLMNYWRASQSIPHSGVGIDHVHITERGDMWTSFNGEEYEYGMTMWNLVALQTLAQIQQVAMK